MVRSVEDVVCDSLENLYDAGFKNTVDYIVRTGCFVTTVKIQKNAKGPVKEVVIVDYETPLILNGDTFQEHSLKLYYDMVKIKKWYKS